MSSAITQDPVSVEDVENDIKRSREDNDPQTIFYLSSTSADLTLQKDVLTTLYFWAAKIEQAVQKNLGKGSDTQRHTLKASWERAAYRAKLLCFLPETTPWLTTDNHIDTSTNKELKGEYHHDKLVYQKVIYESLQAGLPEIPVEKLQGVERYITEIMVLGQDKLDKVLRFALAFPLSIDLGHSTQSGLRIIEFAFERKIHDQDKATLGTTTTLHKASVNKSLFDPSNFDQSLLEAGKALVRDATFHVII